MFLDKVYFGIPHRGMYVNCSAHPTQNLLHVIFYDKNDHYSRVFDVLGIPPYK